MPKPDTILAAVLDTHAWIWLSNGDHRAAKISGFSGTPIVAAISQWEVAMLDMKERVEFLPDLATWISKNLEAPVSLAPLSASIAIQSCRLVDFHGDPADRIITATAITLGVPLITADSKIIEWAKRHPILSVIAL